MISSLRNDEESETESQTTRGRLVTEIFRGEMLSDDSKLSVLQKALAEHHDPIAAGGALAKALVAKVPRHTPIISGMALQLGASSDPAYKPPADDPLAIVNFEVLKALRHGLSLEGVMQMQLEMAAAAGGATALPTSRLPERPHDPRIPPGGKVGANGTILDADGKPILGEDGKPLVADGGVGGAYDADGNWIDLEAAAAEAAAAEARIGDLKRRQAAGELSAEELAELGKLEVRVGDLKGVMATAEDAAFSAAEREADEAKARIDELKRKQAAGELSAEELAELDKLQTRVGELEVTMAQARRGGDEMDGVKKEADEARAHVAELKRRQAAGELSAEELAALGKLEGKLQVLDAMASGGLDADAAAREAKAAKQRVKELKKRQKTGKLTAEELAELRGLEGKIAMLEDVASGRRGGKGSERTDGGRRKVPTAEVGCQAGQSMIVQRSSTGGDLGNMFGGDGSARGKLPDRAVTSLCEIRFNRKDVKAMNVLMCRRLIAALYQSKAESNAADDAENRARQGFPDCTRACTLAPVGTFARA